MTHRSIATNGVQAWVLACRPKTLTGAAAPVLLAWALAWHDGMGESFQWVPALLCMVFALLMQIDANLVNDYFDGVTSRDTMERLGPERTISQGWITPRAMRWGIALCTLASCLTGLPLVLWGGLWMIAVGLMCVLFCFLYTTRLAALGLGDVLVLVFFGLVPVCATYYLLTGELTSWVIVCATVMGMITDLLLLVNNYRDRDLDAKVGKRTLVVTIGEKPTEWLYLMLGVVAHAVVCWGLVLTRDNLWCMPMLLPSLVLHVYNYRKLILIHQGRELNRILGTTALNIFLFSLLLSLAIII